MTDTIARRAAIPVLALAALLAWSSPPRAEEPGPGLDTMIGQMLLVGFTGTSPESNGAQRVAEQIAAGKVGGVILMTRNIRSPSQVRKLTEKFMSAKTGLPPFVAVDQEGGIVQRLSSGKGFKAYPTARSLGRSKEPGKARALYKRMAGELAEAGINLNFGPVVDLDLERSNPVIARRGRSYGTDPAKVAAYARAFISAHRQAGVLTAAKHFPGHGSSIADSHKRSVDVTYSWRMLELEPYRRLSASGDLDMVMVSHVYHPAFSGYDSGHLPASLSPKTVQEWIRGDLGFDGVVITDDLGMNAVSRHYDLRETLLRAAGSGSDILLFSGTGDGKATDPGFVDKAIGILREGVETGGIDRAGIARSYARITTLKQRLRANREVRSGSLVRPVP